jgi:hypothetical protein
MAAVGRVLLESVEGLVVGGVEGGGDQDGGQVVVGQLAGVEDAGLEARVEGAAVEGVEDGLVRAFVGAPVGPGEWRLGLERPLARRGVEEGHVGVGSQG